MSKLPSKLVAADWKLEKIASANNDLNKEYFKTGEYKKYEAYFKLKNAVEYILNQDDSEILTMTDIGCGTGWHAVYLEKEGFIPPIQYSGADLSIHMCRLAEKNFPGGIFFEHDICEKEVSKQDIIMESAVIELVHDWESGFKNMLRSSLKWFVSHRLFVKNGFTKTDQVTTYHNIPDIRVTIGMDDFNELLKEEGFVLENKSLWSAGGFKMGTFVCRRIEND